MRPCPFIVGNSVGNTPAFIGRSDVFEQVDRFLRQPAETGLLLFGQRRIGKTSILHQLRTRLPNEGPWFPVLFDLQGKASASIDQILRSLANAIAATLDLPPPELGVEPQQQFADQWLPKALGTLPPGSRVVLLLDEFDVLANPVVSSATGLFAYLAGLLEGDSSGRLAAIYTIGRTMDDLEAAARFLLRGAKTVHISTLTRREFETLLDLGERDEGLVWGEGVRDALWALTGGHPMLTQMLGSMAWNASRRSGSRVVDQAMLRELAPAVLKEARAMLTWLWDGLTPACRIVAAALAEHGERSVSQSELEILLRGSGVREIVSQLADASIKLRDWDLLDETDGRFHFKVELLRQWIRLHRPFASVREYLDQLVPAANELFETASRLWWSPGEEDATRAAQVTSILELILRDLNPNHVGAAILLAAVCAKAGRFDEAVKVLDRLHATQPTAIRPHLVNTLITWADALDPGAEEQRVQLYRRALELAPGNLEATQRCATIWIERGQRAREAGDWTAALAHFREAGATEEIEAVRLDLRRVDAQRALAEIRRLADDRQLKSALERFDEAREALAVLPEAEAVRAEIARQSQIVDVFGQALGAIEQKDPSAAVSLLQEVIALDPTHHGAARELCALLHPAGEQHRGGSRLWRRIERAAAFVGVLSVPMTVGLAFAARPAAESTAATTCIRPAELSSCGENLSEQPVSCTHEEPPTTVGSSDRSATPAAAPQGTTPALRMKRPDTEPLKPHAGDVGRCNQGDMASCVLAGDLLFKHQRPSYSSLVAAIPFYRRACEGKNADGCYNLSQVLSRVLAPSGPPAREAREYLEQACALGYRAPECESSRPPIDPDIELLPLAAEE